LLYETQLLLGLGVSWRRILVVSWRRIPVVSDIDTNNYIELSHFLKLLIIGADIFVLCLVFLSESVLHMFCLWPCFGD
jgi:hypothetical protein